MRHIYKYAITLAKPLLHHILQSRVKKGKEIAERLPERMGHASKPRPDGKLIWLHAASVGESQSALILINALLEKHPGIHVLVTTGTVTSAQMMDKNLPARAFHQFYPLDHPHWTTAFLDHWHPDLVLWMESELWPNMLEGIEKREIPCALINARLSRQSFKRWHRTKGMAASILKTFSVILTQTDQDAHYYKKLGAQNVITTDNLKYSAAPLPVDEADLNALAKATSGRPLWLYASSHAGEEEIACRIHNALKDKHHGLLTIIAPRHPDRRDAIASVCQDHQLSCTLRGTGKTLPTAADDIYIADTMGELGLLYTLAPMACIGRSLSADGGGGHNPIEAAQLRCAVLFGPNVQYQQDIYDDMSRAGAARQVLDEQELLETIDSFLGNKSQCEKLQESGYTFATGKSTVIDRVTDGLKDVIRQAGL